MARPARLQFPDALYHITARGDRREAIYDDDADRVRFLEVLGEVIEQFHWRCHAYCLMDNHYHLMLTTPDANLSKGMRQLNGVFTQWSNRRHGRIGHLFQGRYKAILVDSDSYLLELSRYVVLNPVRARMVREPAAWAWSSYLATAGKLDPPAWLELNTLLAVFGENRRQATGAYVQFVHAGRGVEPVWNHLNRQAFLGDDAFVTKALRKASVPPNDINIPRVQRQPPALSLKDIAKRHPDRDTGIHAAWATGQYSYAEIAAHYGVHFTTVGRIVRARKLK
ncbi:MAG TPA: transposase [Nevskiaceae bacterium]|nr:transposase [Nevskiaceae bacterium]